LQTIRAALRGEDKKIVFTNGVFDIIHRGHIEYLEKAKALGNVLIVGVNSDESVSRIKGSRRPIIAEGDRTYIVAHLSPVDYVCMFGDDTPLGLISAIRSYVTSQATRGTSGRNCISGSSSASSFSRSVGSCESASVLVMT
jgi:D-beta-D-heptose 7-phosphate kinase/D-beta-D-heptose 1-phosphate adenosyltransferase